MPVVSSRVALVPPPLLATSANPTTSASTTAIKLRPMHPKRSSLFAVERCGGGSACGASAPRPVGSAEVGRERRPPEWTGPLSFYHSAPLLGCEVCGEVRNPAAFARGSRLYVVNVWVTSSPFSVGTRHMPFSILEGFKDVRKYGHMADALPPFLCP